jgi:hypothetical protein
MFPKARIMDLKKSLAFRNQDLTRAQGIMDLKKTLAFRNQDLRRAQDYLEKFITIRPAPCSPL